MQNIESKEVVFLLKDVYGREIFKRAIDSEISTYQFSLNDIARLSNGLYYLEILFGDNKITKKVVKIKSN